jgi:GNAT superfamily N-acetyltransferase
MTPPDPAPVTLRPPAIGDIGWVIHRQALLYNQEYGWNQDFEVLLAGIFAQVMRAPDPAKERGWIAQRNGTILGSAFVARESGTVAKLRLLYAEPAARGQGLGRRLVQECIGFAREAGYATMRLWTNSPLLAARRIYVEQGFHMTAAEPVRAFGQDMVSETWERPL